MSVYQTEETLTLLINNANKLYDMYIERIDYAIVE